MEIPSAFFRLTGSLWICPGNLTLLTMSQRSHENNAAKARKICSSHTGVFLPMKNPMTKNASPMKMLYVKRRFPKNGARSSGSRIFVSMGNQPPLQIGRLMQ